MLLTAYQTLTDPTKASNPRSQTRDSAMLLVANHSHPCMNNVFTTLKILPINADNIRGPLTLSAPQDVTKQGQGEGFG